MYQGRERVAALFDDGQLALAPPGSRDLAAYVAEGEAGLALLRRLVLDPATERAAPAAVQLLPPLRRLHRDVLCTGWNYWDHFYESEGKREGQDVPKPDAPTFFTKGPDVVIGPNDDIAFDAALSSKWDYEAEIVVVIGKTGRSIPKERAMEHVWGYCLANDVSQRDLQRRHGGQWLKGKSIDGTMPLGPWIVPRDAVDLSQVTLECELNGKLMQQASASQMAFSVAELISELSSGMTVRAGDILLTGTPSGIGNARTPPVFLHDGDELRVRATGLGELRNRVRASDLTSYKA
jgi:2-keto-4-pentenoate hydratase/2-oxohepta-3-ene-1,7-dioic acid hydratase in catechol pathway